MPNPIIRGRTGGAFTPLKLPGLQLWLRADKGLYQDSVFTTLATADADPVGGWQDQSGQAHHVIQATSSRRPTLKLNIVNGQPVVRFDSVDDLLAYTGALLAAGDSPMTTYLVTQKSSLSAKVAWEFGPTTSITTPKAYRLYPFGASGANGEIYFSNITNDRATANGAVTTSTWYCIAFVVAAGAFSSSTPSFYRNGASLASTQGTGTLTPNLVATQLSLGADNAPSEFYNGDLAEVLTYNTPHAPADVIRVTRYLGTRYGLAVA